MAKKSSARRITRRDAITLIGVGAISGVPRAASARSPQPHPECKNPATVSHLHQGTTQAIASYSCCEETKHAIFLGVGEPGTPSSQGQTHLKPLQNELHNAQLLEYCFMMWGLTEAQAKNLYERVPKDLKYVPVESQQKK